MATMVQVTIEYMILIPVLILILFMFPIAVSAIMDTWVVSRRTLELKEAASHLGSSIQQVYMSLNHTSIQAGNLSGALDIPEFIEGHVYRGNASFRYVLDPALDPTQVLEITLAFVDMKISVDTSVTLGQNVEWVNTIFLSNSTNACLAAQKLPDGNVKLAFGAMP
jgi:hypothetical protein